MSFGQHLPPLMAALHALPCTYDFVPLHQFQSARDNKSWIGTWTGNKTLTGAEYRVFGHDRAGGRAAIWLAHEPVTSSDLPFAARLLTQPIVFFGGHGELLVLASDFADYLWLLAGGFGPSEAAANSDGAEPMTAQPSFVAFAEAHAPQARKAATAVLAQARAAYPRFAPTVRALC